jgi:hypothetical protein
MLEDYRGSLHVEGDWIFSSGVGTPLDLDNLVKRVIQPSLQRCARCGVALGKHEGSEHEFQLDESLPVWHGYHGIPSEYNVVAKLRKWSAGPQVGRKNTRASRWLTRTPI